MSTVLELLHGNLFRVFNERDAAARQAAIDDVYTDDVVFTDPEGPATGRAIVEERAAKLLGELPSDFVFAEDGIAYTSEDAGALA